MSETRTWPLVDRATTAFAGVGPDPVRLGDYLLDEAADLTDISGITLTVDFNYDEGNYTGVMYVDR